jgi:type IV pilus assembly protein PilC
MLTFVYTAKDPTGGHKITAEVEAQDEAAAAKLIKNEGLAPLSIVVKGGEGYNIFKKLRNRIKTKEKVVFSRQLATLINAGLPLVQSLRNVVTQTENKAFQMVINKVISDVEGGIALSEALAKHPNVFSPVYINLVAAGETSGTLDKALERIANQQEKDAEITSKIRGAMAYPAVVLFVMLGVVGFMIVSVLPQVELIYEDIPGAELPILTKVLLWIAHFVTSYWWVVIVLLALAIFSTTRYARTPGGKQVIDRLKMRAWPIGNLFMKVYMARFSRTGSTLVASGVPLIQMLDVVSKSVNNVHVEASVKRAAEKVKGGKSLATALENDPNFLSLVPNMLKVGEQSGSLEEMLEKTADYYEKEVDNEIKTISTIIEPVLMIVLGVTAFIVVAAILLPIYGLVGKSFIQ